MQTVCAAGPCVQVARRVCAAHHLARVRVPAVVPHQSGAGEGQAALGAVPALLAEDAPRVRLRLQRHLVVPHAVPPLHCLDTCPRGRLLQAGSGVLQVAASGLRKGCPCRCHLRLLQDRLRLLPALRRVAPLGVVCQDVLEQLLPPAPWHLRAGLPGRCRTQGLHPLPLHVQHGEVVSEPLHTTTLSLLLLLRQAGGQLGALWVGRLPGHWGVTECLRWHPLSRRCLCRLREAWGRRLCRAQPAGGCQLRCLLCAVNAYIGAGAGHCSCKTTGHAESTSDVPSVSGQDSLRQVEGSCSRTHGRHVAATGSCRSVNRQQSPHQACRCPSAATTAEAACSSTQGSR